MGEKELKYPIKYAVMSIVEEMGWYTNIKQLEWEDNKVANIVSKCYVIGERKEYLNDGTFEITYEVVFPFIKEWNDLKPVVPEYNFYSQCINSTFVSQLYDDFEEAQIAANKANEEIVAHEIGIIPLDQDAQKNIKIVKEKHQRIFDRYKEIEKIMEQKTCDMKITYSSCLENIIEKVIEKPSDFYTKLAKELSDEEREYLKQLIKNRSCNNCINSSCMEYYEQVKLDDLGKSQGSSCLNWNSYELIGRQFILEKSHNS